MEIVCVNDGSTESYSENLEIQNKVKIINLIRNVGHQKAIAIGISYVVCEMPFDLLAVMDSDGEDDPDVLQKLISSAENDNVVFAKRVKRKENTLFKVFYRMYKLLFYVLTGKKISFGNFSVLSYPVAYKLANDSDLWINYSSCIINNKIKTTLIDSIRAKRYYGKSKMNFQSLLLHGLGAISIHIEKVTARLLILVCTIAAFSVIGLFIVLYIKMFTNNAVPGWATNFITALILIIFQTIMMGLLLTFIVLNRKTQKASIPKLDYINYIE